jgi:glycosyltransferase involved in cell wall biosynthesis
MTSNNKPLVSIIIPAYNSGKYIKQCLDSVVAQTYSNWECFIILAPSTDNTLDEIWKCLDITNPKPKIHIIKETKKSNCAKARNIGYDNSNGEYVTFLDADDWWEPKNLETMISMMKKHTWVEWCAHYQVIHKGDEIFTITELPGTVKEIGGIGGCLYKKSLLDKIKNEYGYVFDESLNHTDDGDLTLRVRKYPAYLIPVFLSHYRWNTEGLTATTDNIEQSWGIVKMLIKRGAWDLLPYHLKNLGVCVVEEITGLGLVRKG